MTDLPTVFVAAGVAARLHALPRRPWEIGGWLLGYWTEQRSAVFVTHATPPAHRGTPWGVRISGNGHRERFDEAWQATGGLVTFLGDWHTHPRGSTDPSLCDARAARQLSEEACYGTPTPVIAITALPRYPLGRQTCETGWYVRVADGLKCVEPRIARSLPPRAEPVPTWEWPQVRRSRAKRKISLIARFPLRR